MKTNRKNCKIIMFIIVIILMFTTIVACNSGEEMRFYELKYSSTEGGTVNGNCEQKVQEGYNGSQVMAIANEGYKFIGWSDGIKTEKASAKRVLFYIPLVLIVLPTFAAGIDVQSAEYFFSLLFFTLSVAIAEEIYFNGNSHTDKKHQKCLHTVLNTK